MAGMKKWLGLTAAGMMLGGWLIGDMAWADAVRNDLLVTAEQDGHYTRFIAAAKTTGLAEMLQDEGPLTLFIPTDKAFAAIDPATRDKLFSSSSRDRLKDVLELHVVPGDYTLETALQRVNLMSEQGQALKLSRSGGRFLVNDAHVIGDGIKTGNGRLYTIDKVLMPKQ